MQPPGPQIGIDRIAGDDGARRAPKSGKCIGVSLHPHLFLCGIRRRKRRQVRPQPQPDSGGGFLECPAEVSHQKIEAVTRAAVVADEGASAFLVVEAKAILATADRARAVPAVQMRGLNTKALKQVMPTTSRQFTGFCVHQFLLLFRDGR